jgi:hypothetical protein
VSVPARQRHGVDTFMGLSQPARPIWRPDGVPQALEIRGHASASGTHRLQHHSSRVFRSFLTIEIERIGSHFRYLTIDDDLFHAIKAGQLKHGG